LHRRRGPIQSVTGKSIRASCLVGGDEQLDDKAICKKYRIELAQGFSIM